MGRSIRLETGRIRRVLVFENKEPQFCHPMNSYGTPTPVIYDGIVFVHFGTHGTAALDAKSGKKIWARRDFKCDHFEVQPLLLLFTVTH